MKIRSVQLTNFRKFQGAFRVDGIADGVNVLVGNNELGKSTLLAAINAVIFERAKSQTKTTESFQHFVNGTVPEVELTFDLDGASWTIRKRFAGQSGKAVLTSTGNRRFEGEAAEMELQRLLQFEGRRSGAEHGIWGTLWVTQGKSFGDPEMDDASRRTLQGCIEAQVGVVTGGDRGRKIPLAVDEALREIMNARGPSGKYKQTLVDLEEATALATQLDRKRNEVFEHMDSLARQKRDRRSLEAGWSDEVHRHELDESRLLRIAAATKALEIDAARIEANSAADRAARELQAVEVRARLARSLEAIENDIRLLTVQIEQVKSGVNQERSMVEVGDRTLADLRDKLRLNGERGRRLERLRSSITFQAEIQQHQETLSKASELQVKSGELSQWIGRITATDDSVSRIETASANLAGASAALQAKATTVDFTIDTAALHGIRIDDAPMATGITSLSVVARTQITIDGIGTITIDPQIREADAIVNQLLLAEEEVKAALEAAGVKNLNDARQAVAQRHEFERQLADVRREIAGLAPKEKSLKLDAGLESRQARIRELQGRLAAEFEALGVSMLPTAEEVDKDIFENHDRTDRLTADIAMADAAAGVPRSRLDEATGVLHTLEQRLAGLKGSYETTHSALMASRNEFSDEQLSANALLLAGRSEEAKSALKAIESNQGETVAAVDSRIKRLEALGKNHHESLARLNNEITRLTTLIEANEGAGIEEALGFAQADQTRLEAAVKGYEEEVSVLQLLQETLRDAESEVNSLYLAPIVSRVEPYLKMLLPGTDLMLDENLGISSLKRNGTDEAFERLSDGTQEQLAILTRLAFAELLLTKGRPATVILDDAMAFSDDERIERMFDILTRAGDKVQILVLTCRKKLFTRFGGTELMLREIPSG